MLAHTFLIIISAWQCTEVETEGGGGAERWAESFYLTPWDDVKSPTSLPPPTPSSLPYAEELATGFVWGVGVMTERTHMHAVSPPSSKMENNRYFCFWGTTQDCARTTKRTTSPAWGDSVTSKQHSAGKKRAHNESMNFEKLKYALPLSSLKQLAAWRFSELLRWGSCG